ncbi:MAG: ATP-dependent RNA helicase RhlE [Chlamydiae bacterium]|nr:ATP-dependent RNA helicase RhlE [Chlamydiota bacterium]
MLFKNLGLSAELVDAVTKQGYSSPTPIQSQAIPTILNGKDILASAQTGTGKTAGFTLPMLHLLSRNPKSNKPRPVRALILVPTRELAAQVNESIVTYGKNLSLKSAVVFGGVKIEPQIRILRHGVDILVATPGRLLDHASQKTVDLSSVEILVLDEADRMLDMGFIHDVRRVLKLLPKKRQSLLFSATFSTKIKNLADSILNSPVTIEVARRNTPAEQVAQVIYNVDRKRKAELLSHLITSQNWQQVLVFTRTKHGANRLAEKLDKDGIKASAMHGNKSQSARTKALANFKDASIRVLVATDIAARGIDIDQLPHVVNFELPNVPEDYVHRIGRTARAGREGEAASLVCVDEHKLLHDIERLIKKDISKKVVPGFEPDPSIKPEPIRKPRGPRPERKATFEKTKSSKPQRRPQRSKKLGTQKNQKTRSERKRRQSK